jgi:hypothetical protein
VAVAISELRKLLQRSGNVCAYPGCTVRLTSAGTGSDPVVVVSEVAHIVAESPDGPRGDSPLSEPERNRYESLILLCNVHHQLIDSQPATYTVEWLMEIKHEHERWVEQRLEGIDIARLAQARRPVTPVHPQTFGTVGAITDPVLLGIHPAIPLKVAVEGLDSQLPTYIRRDIDANLRTPFAKISAAYYSRGFPVCGALLLKVMGCSPGVATLRYVLSVVVGYPGSVAARSRVL